MGGETDISGFGTQGSQIPVPAGAPSEVGETPEMVGAPPAPTQSTIKKSELEKFVEAFIAGLPILQPPQTNVTFQDLSDPNAMNIHGSSMLSFAYKIEEINHQIIIDMWDKYSETLKKIAREREEEYREKWGKDVTKAGPKSQAEFNAYLQALPATAKSDEIGPSGDAGLNVKFGAAFSQWVINPAENGTLPNGNYPDSRFIAGAVASAPDLVSQTIGVAGAAGLQMSVSPIADAMTALGPVSALPLDTQLATAMVAALLYNGATNKANNDALADSANKSQPLQTVDFAINYAKNILAIVTHNVEGDEAASPESRGQNRLIKLMLATTALTLLHRGVFGGVNAKDIQNLIGTNDIDKADIPEETKALFRSLASNINNLLNEDPVTREAMIAQMAQYADKKETVESMLKSTNLLMATLDTSEIRSNRLAVKQG